MNRIYLITVIFLTTIYCSYAEDVYFKVIEDTPGWGNTAYYGKDYIDTIIKKDTIVKGYSGIGLTLAMEDGFAIIQRIMLENRESYVVYANALLPLETEILLPESLVTKSESIDSKIWILNHFVNALASNDRNKVWNYDREYWERFTARPLDEYPGEWWVEVFLETRFVQTQTGKVALYRTLLLTQTGIEMYNSPDRIKNLIIKNICKEGNGYRVTVIDENEYSAHVYGSNIPWSDPSKREFFDILVIPDGDYLDMYLDNLNTPLVTFASVDEIFMKELSSLIMTKSCNLKNISWPRRANGTMDYPPPVDMSNYQTTHHTTDNLRLRDEPNTSSLMVTTLSSGSAVQVLETGTSQTIEDITAPWVKVLSESGYTGWCFSGYLEEIPKEEPVIVPVSTTPEPSEHTENIEPVRSDISDTNIFDMPIPLAVGGGVIVIAVGIILVVRRKKKN